MPQTYIIIDLNGKETVGTFHENESQKKKKSLELSRKKAINYMLNGKTKIVLLLFGLIKNNII